MSSMTETSWPPSEELLNWRPAAESPADFVTVTHLLGEDRKVPDWVDLPDDVPEEDKEDEEVPAHTLAFIELDAGRPGGGAYRAIHAVPAKDGALRIVIVNDDDIPWSSPIDRLPALPTLGEVLRILDETLVDGEVYGVGHPTRVANDVNEHREELRDFITISSELYPQLYALDQSRLDQWIAEKP